MEVIYIITDLRPYQSLGECGTAVPRSTPKHRARLIWQHKAWQLSDARAAGDRPKPLPSGDLQPMEELAPFACSRRTRIRSHTRKFDQKGSASSRSELNGGFDTFSRPAIAAATRTAAFARDVTQFYTGIEWTDQQLSDWNCSRAVPPKWLPARDAAIMPQRRDKVAEAQSEARKGSELEFAES